MKTTLKQINVGHRCAGCGSCYNEVDEYLYTHKELRATGHKQHTARIYSIEIVYQTCEFCEPVGGPTKNDEIMPKGFKADGTPLKPPVPKPTQKTIKGPFRFDPDVMAVLEDLPEGVTITAYLQGLVRKQIQVERLMQPLRDMAKGSQPLSGPTASTSLFNVWEVKSEHYEADLLRATFLSQDQAVSYANGLRVPVYVEHVYAAGDRTLATTFLEFVYDSRQETKPSEP